VRNAKSASTRQGQNPSGSVRKNWRYRPHVQYGILKVLRDAERPLYLVEWAKVALACGIYQPYEEANHARCNSWGSKAGRILSAFGLVKRSTNEVGYNMQYVQYELTNAGQRWMTEYEREGL